MDKFDYASALQSSNPAKLSKIMGIQGEVQDLWRPEDRSALLRNQLAAPILFDLRGLVPQSGHDDREKTLTSAEDVRITTFQEMFDHPNPPLALLNLTKDFFKSGAGSLSKRDSGQEVAYVMYLLCIATGRIRYGKSISSLKDRAILKALHWAGAQDWIEGNTRSRILDAISVIQAGKV